jgi:hypothetical protein
MSILSAIFNPTLLIFISVLLLVTSLLIVYFENKMREQNHKISSMLSLVSSLAEELNKIKFHLSHANMNAYTYQNNSLDNVIPNKIHVPENNLIEVSDDEDNDEDYYDYEDVGECDEDEEEDDDDDDNDDDDDDDDDDDNDEDDYEKEEDGKKFTINEISENDIKILNLDNNLYDDYNDDNDDNVDDDDLEDIDPNELTDNESLNELNDSKIQEEYIITGSNVKSINMVNNLEEEKNKNVEVIDYKKLALTKLKAIVLEKGLVADSSKLKKQELLKLLNAE